MKIKQVIQYFFLLGFLGASCTSIERYEPLNITLSTKSPLGNKFSLSEKEIVEKAAQFFQKLEESGKDNAETRSISSMNLSEKTPQVKMVIRTIRYGENDVEHVPVYVINYTVKRGNSTGGYVVMTGDQRLNSILVYSDSGSWGDNDPSIQNFVNFFWENVDELIKRELAVNSLYPITKSRAIHLPCDFCYYYSEFDYIDNAKRLAQPALWSQLDPYNGKLAPNCTPPPTGKSLYYPVGCWATAMGQIMAYHQKPTSGSYTNYLGQTVNVTYNWNTMLTSQYAGNLSSQGQEMVQHLLAQIGQLQVLNNYGYYYPLMTYGCSDSGSDMYKARQGFALMGYSTAPIGVDYDYNAVSSEIYANRPVAADAWNIGSPFTKHAWVMDGVNSQTVVQTKYRYCPTVPTGVHNPIVEDILYSYINYVYCNLGAETPGNWNGYYRSDIFLPIQTETAILTNIQ